MSLSVTDDRSEGDRQTSVQMTNGSKSEVFSEFSRDRGGDRRPVGGEQLVQVEEVECTSSGVECHSGARLTCAPRAPKDSFDQPEDLLLSVRRVEDPRKQTYKIFPFRAGRTTHICCGMNVSSTQREKPAAPLFDFLTVLQIHLPEERGWEGH